jgi:hypothetical protein
MKHAFFLFVRASAVPLAIFDVFGLAWSLIGISMLEKMMTIEPIFALLGGALFPDRAILGNRNLALVLLALLGMGILSCIGAFVLGMDSAREPDEWFIGYMIISLAILGALFLRVLILHFATNK